MPQYFIYNKETKTWIEVKEAEYVKYEGKKLTSE